MNDCLSNLNKCKANCCKLVSIQFSKHQNVNNALLKRESYYYTELSNDLIKYYRMHDGIRITTIPGGGCMLKFSPELKRTITEINDENFIIFNSRCKHLKQDNTCDIYDSKERPNICKNGYNKTSENVIFCPHCIYNKKDSIVLDEKVIKELIP